MLPAHLLEPRLLRGRRRVLDYLDILDYQRSSDGKVDGFSDRAAQPHLLRFHPEALDRPAFPTIIETITEQIAKSEDS
jgi:hypothetical protein